MRRYVSYTLRPGLNRPGRSVFNDKMQLLSRAVASLTYDSLMASLGNTDRVQSYNEFG